MTEKPINKKDAWIQTFSGIKFSIFDPRLEDILIPDIAHALSNNARFGGHTREFSSVAQHSVLCAKIAEQELETSTVQLACLLHDSSEAYLCDLPSPIKRAMPIYAEVENKLHEVIAERFNLKADDFKNTKKYDEAAFLIEAQSLIAPFHPEWTLPKPLVYPVTLAIFSDFYVMPWQPEKAEKEFLELFQKLWVARRGIL